MKQKNRGIGPCSLPESIPRIHKTKPSLLPIFFLVSPAGCLLAFSLKGMHYLSHYFFLEPALATKYTPARSKLT